MTVLFAAMTSKNSRMRNSIFFVALPWLFFASTVALAGPVQEYRLDPEIRLEQYVDDAWGTDAGFPPRQITGITQGPKGYLWLGTAAGLYRFDGVRFTVFSSKTEPAFTNDRIETLHLTSDNTLWVATNEGLVCYKDGRFFRPAEFSILAQDWVPALTEGPNGVLWVWATETGLIRCEQGELRRIEFPDGTVRRVRSMLHDDHGSLWLGTTKGLWRYREGSAPERVPVEGDVKALYQEGQSGLWAGSDNGPLVWVCGWWPDALSGWRLQTGYQSSGPFRRLCVGHSRRQGGLLMDQL